MHDRNEARNQKPGTSEEDNPDSLQKWVLGIVIVAAYIYLRVSGFEKLYCMVMHSRWWLGLSPLRRHLLPGILLTGLGSFWLRVEIRDLERTPYPHRIIFAAMTTIWEIYELFEAALVS